MTQGRHTSIHIHLDPADRAVLRAWQRSSMIQAGLARRGRILLLAEEGHPLTEVARIVGLQRRFVYKWIARYQAEGLAGLQDKTRAWTQKRSNKARARAQERVERLLTQKQA